jgi:hypothetical protein
MGAQLLLFDVAPPEGAESVPSSERVGLVRPPKEEVLPKAHGLALQLSRELGVPVKLSVTDNRSTMVSFHRRGGTLRLRVHHMFLDAPPAVVRAVADYAGGSRSAAGRVLDEFIKNQQPRIRRQRTLHEPPLLSRGRHFDLADIFRRLNDAHFEAAIQARIGWGRMPPNRRRRKTIRLGVYDHPAREIRIHPALDRADVPLYFVEFVVFHEMLHQLFPSDEANSDGGRREHHPVGFRDRERCFPLYDAALHWERENLGLLLKRASSGG